MPDNLPSRTPHPTEFTQHITRWGTASAKWDLLTKHLGDDAFSLGVADMEFLSAPQVRQAVNEAAQHGLYGYTEIFDDFLDAAYQWQEKQHHWVPPRDSAIFFPRIIQCLSALLTTPLPRKNPEALTIATLTPAYGPLVEVSAHSGAKIISVPLRSDHDAAYHIDWDALEAALRDADLLLWCNPHNPTGRVWTAEELAKLADLALQHSTLIFSDDIHSDFTRPGRTPYTPLALINPELWERELLIQCASPGKTFNTAGLESAVMFAPPQLRASLEQAKRTLGIHNPNYFAVPATIAAWTQCDEWLTQLRAVIDANLTHTVAYLREHLPEAHVTDPDGTYLVWVDARAYLRHRSLEHVEASAHVGVSNGLSFGESYAGFFRLNVALPPDQCAQALQRLCAALNEE